MQVNFYKTDNEFYMLYLLLNKGAITGKTFNVFFKNNELAKEFSVFLWNRSSLAHGLKEDGYYKLQPIIMCAVDEYALDMKKDIAVFIGCQFEEQLENNLNDLNKWEKVFFVNIKDEVYKKYPEFAANLFEYFNGSWQKAV